MILHFLRLISPVLSGIILASSVARAWEYSAYEPFPNGRVLLSCPTILWRIWPGKDTRFTGISMTLNDKPVQATYSREEKAVVYRPRSPLSPGVYAVRCKVVLNNGQHSAEREWHFDVAADALSEVPVPDGKQQAARDAVNSFRRRLGLPAMKLDARLCAAATAHSNYAHLNPQTWHEEQSGKAGFIGVDLMARTAAFGYEGGCYEDIHTGKTVPSEAVKSLFDAPYHRIPFMQPGSPDLGAGMVGKVMTLVFGKTLETGVVTCPADKQRDVPLRWHSTEIPDPLRLHRARAPVGYIISFHYFQPEKERIRVTRATLMTDDGNAVPFYLNTPANDSHLTDSAFLIPGQILKPHTTYLVSVEASTAAGKNISRRWSFTTTDAPVRRKTDFEQPSSEP